MKKNNQTSSATQGVSVECQQERKILLNELNGLHADMVSFFIRLDKLSAKLDGEIDESFKKAYDKVEESASMLEEVLDKIFVAIVKYY